MKDAIWFLAAVIIVGCLFQWRPASVQSNHSQKRFVKNHDEVGESGDLGMVAVESGPAINF